MADLNQAQLLSATSLQNGRALTLTVAYQTIHVAVNSTSEWDVVTLFLNHTGAGNVDVTIKWGDIEFVVLVGSHVLVVALDRWRINSGLQIQVKGPTDCRAYIMVDRYPAG